MDTKGRTPTSLLFKLFGPQMKKRAVAADSAWGMLEVGSWLKSEGFQFTADCMLEELEHFQDVRKANKTVENFVALMDERTKGNIAVKPTMLGLGLNDRSMKGSEMVFQILLGALLERVCLRFPEGVDIEVDAEDAGTVEQTYRVVSDIRKAKPHLAHRLRVAVQMHLPELANLDHSYDLFRHPVRLVKGSGVYQKDARRARVPEKDIPDRMISCFFTSIRNGQKPFYASAEDEEGVEVFLQAAEAARIPKDSFEIQMLLGFGMHLAYRWRDRGYTVRFYCPWLPIEWGDRWIPYVERRFPMLIKNKLRWLKRLFARLWPKKLFSVVPPMK